MKKVITRKGVFFLLNVVTERAKQQKFIDCL